VSPRWSSGQLSRWSAICRSRRWFRARDVTGSFGVVARWSSAPLTVVVDGSATARSGRSWLAAHPSHCSKRLCPDQDGERKILQFVMTCFSVAGEFLGVGSFARLPSASLEYSPHTLLRSSSGKPSEEFPPRTRRVPRPSRFVSIPEQERFALALSASHEIFPPRTRRCLPAFELFSE
jgi:hypothetical protein